MNKMKRPSKEDRQKNSRKRVNNTVQEKDMGAEKNIEDLKLHHH
jgi:hypothetical protein